jgi:hypothetical protein
LPCDLGVPDRAGAGFLRALLAFARLIALSPTRGLEGGIQMPRVVALHMSVSLAVEIDPKHRRVACLGASTGVVATLAAVGLMLAARVAAITLPNKDPKPELATPGGRTAALGKANSTSPPTRRSRQR